MCDFYYNSLNTAQCPDQAYLGDRIIVHAPVLIFLTLIIVFSLPSNALVFYVYHFKLPTSVFGLFVKFLALYDILYCVATAPVIIAFKLVPNYFNIESTCGFLTFAVLFSLVTGGIILIIIAFQRYRSICSIGKKQITIAQARTICFFTPITGLALSLPLIFAVTPFAMNVLLTSRNVNVTTFTCQLKPFSTSVLSVFVTVMIFVEMCAISVVLVTMYTQIWRVIKRQMSVAMTTSATAPSRILVASKTSTKVFFILSLIYCLTHLPPVLLLVTSSQLAQYNNERLWSLELRMVIDIAAYIQFVNSVANPIVYGVLCRVFRQECRKLFRRSPKRLRQTAKFQARTET